MAKKMDFNFKVIPFIAVGLLMFANCIFASPDPLKCEGIKCPPMSEISCPEDSQFREYIDFSSSEITTDPSEIIHELLDECCTVRKCACKLCNIPSCENSSLVIYESIPETQIPGRCCGKYECTLEPNCTEVRDTEGFWLTDCQRCKCLYGQRICHRSCDEIMPNPTTAYCKSKSLNRFFSHGEVWKDGCYECECQNGEEKCVMPFCRSVNCPHERQVLVMGDCCPVCWPDTATPAVLAPPIIVPKPANTTTTTTTPEPTTTSTTTTTTTTTSSSTTTTTTTESPPQLPPCVFPRDDQSITYALYPEVVEVVHPADNDNTFYIIISTFLIISVLAVCAYYYMRAKKHSYNTVLNFEDNPRTTLKIHKSEDLI